MVLSRKPKTVTQSWKPRGNFKKKTLAELLRDLHTELPFGASGTKPRGLVFTFENGDMKLVEYIPLNPNEDERRFQSMKRYVEEQISAREVQKGGEPPRQVMDVLIEPIYHEDEGEGGHLEDIGLEW